MTIKSTSESPLHSENHFICQSFDHVVFYVSSPKLVANHFCNIFGFSLYAYKGLETGSRNVSATAIKNGNVILVLMGALRPHCKEPRDPLTESIHSHIATHGDGVKDVAFQTSDINLIVKRAQDLQKEKSSDSLIICGPEEISDSNGTIRIVTIKGINHTQHTFVDRTLYHGFLPGFRLYESAKAMDSNIYMNCIDHCVQNENWNGMLSACTYYEKLFGFHVFWSVDEKQVYTKYSALKSTVMASDNEVIKMPINEPAVGLKKSQIEEFVEFYGGAGIQHIAIKVDNIIETITDLRTRGVDFIEVPTKYYINLEKKLKTYKHPEIKETLKNVKKLGILVDFDENGYLLQLFTRPIFERPTFFFEIIQRFNHNGFGAGNFKGLFEVLEKDQEKRGNLTRQL